MNKHVKKIILLVSMALFIFASCEKDETEPDPPVNGPKIIYVTEKIASPTTWYEGNIYLIDINGDFVVESVLTIEQGVIIKFLKDNQKMKVNEGADIQAVGTAGKPIIFTSKYDDANGGDNLYDGPTVGTPGDWGMIILAHANESNFSYCQFYYGGGSLYSTLEADWCTVNISNCIFAFNNGGEHFGYIGVVNLDEAEPDCIFRNNTMFANILPLVISADISIDNSNSFFDPEDSSIGNVMNGIYTNDYTIETDVSWRETEVAYIVGNDYHLTIEEGGKLTLSDNVVIKVLAGTELIIEPGSGGIINNDGLNVFFTSIYDDSKKGDSNGDLNATSPSNGDWKGIRTLDTPLTYADWDNIIYAANP